MAAQRGHCHLDRQRRHPGTHRGSGPWFQGILTEGAGSQLAIQRGTVSTTSSPATAVGASLGSSITLDGTVITTLGASAAGITARESTIDASNFTITTRGDDNAMGVLADLASTINVTGGTITTYGNQVRAGSFAHALGARNPDGVLNAQGTVANTFGTLAMGVWADDGGTATVNDVTVTTQGSSANGVFAIVEQTGAQFPATVVYNRGSVETFGALAHGAAAQARIDRAGELASITLTATPVTTHGDGAIGLRASLADYGSTPTGRGSAQVVANNLSVTTSGTGARDALSRDNPTFVRMGNVQLRPSGVGAHGAVAEIGGHVIGESTTVAPTGVDAMALYVVGLPTLVSQADFSNSTLTNVSGPIVGVAGNGRIGLTGTRVSGASQWLRVGALGDFPTLATNQTPIQGPVDLPDLDGNLPPEPPPLPPVAPTASSPGLADIVATNSALTGSAFTAPGSVSNLTLVESLWTMTGSSNLTTLVNDPSRIEFSPPPATRPSCPATRP